MKRIVVVIASLLTLTGGCVLPPIGDALLVCTADADCPTSQVCVQRSTDDNRLCRPAGAPCVATIGGVTAEQPDGTACAEVEDGICVAGACVVARCGDGIVSGDETCDGGDGCRADCSRCGDGVVDDGEQCDNGRLNSDIEPGACRATCVLAGCGDGVRDPDEGCDGDEGCRADCSRCGDGVIDDGEGCDDGAANSDVESGACRTTCVPAGCGDGVRDPDEGCDDGDLNDDTTPDACRTDCVRPGCGDGVVDEGEACDDGNRVGGDGCRGDCLKVEVCGDGSVDEGERCDDGNDNPRDGCRACRPSVWEATVVVPGRSGGRDARLTAPRGVAIDAVGGIYVADTAGHRVLRVDPACLVCGADDECADCVVDVIAGIGVAGFGGDGGEATQAELRSPSDVVIANDGRVFIADTLNNRIRVVDTSGRITTFAEGLQRPRGLALGAVQGTFLLVAEEGAGRVLQIGQAGLRTVIAGGGNRPLIDGASATSGALQAPVDVVQGADGVVFVAEAGAGRIRRVDLGVVRTVVGGGQGLLVPDAVATAVRLEALAGLALDGDTLVFTEQVSRRVWRLDDVTGRVSVVAGSGAATPTDDGVATSRGLGRPSGLAVQGGVIAFADEGQHVVRTVSAGQLRRGLGQVGVEGAPVVGAAATSVTIGRCVGVAELDDGRVVIADEDARRVLVRGVDGLTSVLAGTGDVGVVDADVAVGQAASAVAMTPLAMIRRSSGGLAVLVDRPGDGGVDLLEITPAGVITAATPAVVERKAGTFALAERPDGRLVIVGTDVGMFVEDSTGVFVDVSSALGLSGFQSVAVGADDRIAVVAEEHVFEAVLRSPDALELIEVETIGRPTALAFRGQNLLVAVADDPNAGVFDVGPLSGIVRPDPVRIVGFTREAVAGDGGLAPAAAIGEVATMSVVGQRLLLADANSGLIRRVDDDNVILTVAGPLHPEGPGRLARASLYGPTRLLAYGDGSLIAHGAHGRVLEIRPDDETVRVIYGHPGAIQNPTSASLRPLLNDTATVFLTPIEDAFGVTTQSRIGLVTRASPGDWRFAFGQSVVGNVLTSITALDDERVVASQRAQHCVRIVGGDVPEAIIFGTCGTAGSFDGFVRSPGALAVAPTGAIYLADVGNNRVLRRDPEDGAVSIVVGDGSPSSAGRGAPARIFPVNAPGQLAVDAQGNLFIASTTTVRVVADTNGSGDADGDDTVETIFPAGGGEGLGLACLQGLTLAAGDGPGQDRLWVGDACAGTLLRLDLVDAL